MEINEAVKELYYSGELDKIIKWKGYKLKERKKAKKYKRDIEKLIENGKKADIINEVSPMVLIANCESNEVLKNIIYIALYGKHGIIRKEIEEILNNVNE